MNTIMVNVKGILKDSFILFALPNRFRKNLFKLTPLLFLCTYFRKQVGVPNLVVGLRKLAAWHTTPRRIFAYWLWLVCIKIGERNYFEISKITVSKKTFLVKVVCFVMSTIAKRLFNYFYTTEYELFSLTEDINDNISCPIWILTIPGEPANTLEVVAQGDNCRFFAYLTVVFNHLPQPHSREQAITQTAPFFCIEL